MHLLAMQQKCRFTDSDEAKERPDRRSAYIACAATVFPAVLDEGQEPRHEIGIEVGDEQVDLAAA